eukprot:g32908.t1
MKRINCKKQEGCQGSGAGAVEINHNGTRNEQFQYSAEMEEAETAFLRIKDIKCGSDRAQEITITAICTAKRTIVYLSIVYTIGQLVISVSSIADITDINNDGHPNNPAVH